MLYNRFQSNAKYIYHLSHININEMLNKLLDTERGQTMAKHVTHKCQPMTKHIQLDKDDYSELPS